MFINLFKFNGKLSRSIDSLNEAEFEAVLGKNVFIAFKIIFDERYANVTKSPQNER